MTAQRWLDTLTLKLGPALAAGLVSYSHGRGFGQSSLVFACILLTASGLDGARFPLHLMPAARLVLGLAAPVFGWIGAVALTLLAGADPHLADGETVILAAWLVALPGAWVRHRVGRAMPVRTAVIGGREFVGDLRAELEAAGIEAYQIVGYLGPADPDPPFVPRLGPLEEVRAVIGRERIELLVSAPPSPPRTQGPDQRPDSAVARVAEECLHLPVRLISANQLYEEVLGHVPIGTINAAWYAYMLHPNFRISSPLSHRCFDLVVGALTGVALAPLMAIAAIAVRLSDGGPAFYRQIRLGEHGRPFEIIKLRTMRLDAERGGVIWSAPADPRVTRVGRLLRRTHFDELPQLWNVLRGEMTLVGPRPERPEIVASLERTFPHYARRHLVKPGVTGWAALRCGYAGSELGTAWKLSHDLFYIKRRSLPADMLILIETVVEVFRDAHRALRTPHGRFLIGHGTQAEPQSR